MNDPNKKRCRWITATSVVVLVLVIIVAVVVLTRNKEEATRTEQLLNLLADNDISNIDDLRTEGTPQNEAAIWIAKHDKFGLPIGMMYDALVDRYTLAVLYFALGGDEKWPQSLIFLSGDKHVCEWWEYLEDSSQNINVATMAKFSSSVEVLRDELGIGGVIGCIDIDGDLVPTGISLRKYSFDRPPPYRTT